MINVLEILIMRIQEAVARVAAGQLPLERRSEAGFTTAELLGNAALGVVALVLIWGAMQKLGLDVMKMIQDKIMSGQ